MKQVVAGSGSDQPFRIEADTGGFILEESATAHIGLDVSGERHGMAKLSETQVREILKRVSNGEVQRRLAFEYGISPALVCCLVKGKKWRHLRE